MAHFDSLLLSLLVISAFFHPPLSSSDSINSSLKAVNVMQDLREIAHLYIIIPY